MALDKKESAENIKDYEAVLKILDSIRKEKDCTQAVKETRYAMAEILMKNAVNVKDYREALKIYDSLQGSWTAKEKSLNVITKLPVFTVIRRTGCRKQRICSRN